MNRKINEKDICTQHMDESSIKLDKNQYTISLLKNALEQGNIQVMEAANTQRNIMELLKKLIMRYTRGESSSVTEDTAESLLNSILYTIDFYLLQSGSIVESLSELQHQKIDIIYEKGVELINSCVKETEKLYWKIMQEKLNVDVEAYSITLEEGIPIFFEKYNIVFQAHNAIASIDYPLVFDDMRVRGISYIKNYLEHLEIETEFCKKFSEEEINKLLVAYGKMCRLNHKIELINIFEVILNNAIFSDICGNKSVKLSISEQQYYKLNIQLNKMERGLVKELINSSLENIIGKFGIKNDRLIEYMKNYADIFINRIYNALENDCLDSIIAVNHPQSKLYETVFDEEKRMSTKEFKELFKKTLNCSNGVEKAELINSSIHSLQDYIDMLNGDCLFEKDFDCLFSALGEIELTVLVKVVFYEEIRDGEINIDLLISKKDYIEVQWQKKFCEFLKTLDLYRIRLIERLIDEVDYEEVIF